MNNKLPKTSIKQYPFTDDGAKSLLDDDKGTDWPVVYILDGKGNSKPIAYVGETSSAYYRMRQHLKNEERKPMANEYVLFNDMFNKSAILDIENMLIEHMHADNKYELQNRNNGQSQYHNYYQRGVYKDLFKDIWKQLKRKGLVQNSLAQVENSNLFKYSPFKQLTMEQYDLEKTILSNIEEALKNNQKREILIEGGAGTGKSILAISLIKYLVDVTTQKIDYSDIDDLEDLIDDYLHMRSELSKYKNLSIAYVVPLTEFRNSIIETFDSIPALKEVDVINPNDLTKKEGGYDIVIVDEAHHLTTYSRSTNHRPFKQANQRLGFKDTFNTTQLDWIQKQTKKVAIYFYDSKQSTSGADIPAKDFNEIKSSPNNKTYSLKHQIRLVAGENYINYWKQLLNNQTKEDAPDFRGTGYDFAFYDNASLLMDKIIERNKECNGLCRVLSGYGFPFTKTRRDKKGKNARRDYDFILDGKKYSWNEIDGDFLKDDKNLKLIGYVKTCQGFDLNYAGVIFSNDIRYNPETQKIECVIENYYDRSGKIATDDIKTIEDIINSYLVLLTRGIKGTYIYCCDKNLRDYLKRKFKTNIQ